jgi:hypothetical protein
MKIDIKITAWERVQVPEDLEEEVLAAIKSGQLNTTEEILSFCENSGLGLAEWEVLPESEEYMSLEDNNGEATIEVLDSTETIYTNKKD